MKKLLSAFALAGVLLCWLACNKNTSNSSLSKSNTGVQALTFSNQSVKQGQPLVASLPKGVSSSNVRWSISPDSTVHITMDSGQVTLLFFRAGRYTVSASYTTGSDSVSRDSCSGTITVSDSIYTPPPPPPVLSYDTTAITNDTLTLTPVSDTGRLILIAQSSRRYGCLPYYIYSIQAGLSTGISLQFQSVVANSVNACGAPSPAVSSLYLQNLINGWANGTYPFSVTYSGITYTGSLTITDSDYTFTWNYSTGVIISPLHVKR